MGGWTYTYLLEDAVEVARLLLVQGLGGGKDLLGHRVVLCLFLLLLLLQLLPQRPPVRCFFLVQAFLVRVLVLQLLRLVGELGGRGWVGGWDAGGKGRKGREGTTYPVVRGHDRGGHEADVGRHL